MIKEREQTIIAIDPGISNGGIVIYFKGDVAVIKMPNTFPEIGDVFKAIKDENKNRDIVVYIEDVGKHIRGNNASASAKFARHCGHLEMALYALGLPTVNITANKWQKVLWPLTHGMQKEQKAKRKNEIKQKMQQRYPSIKVTLWNSDALGILEYAKLRVTNS